MPQSAQILCVNSAFSTFITSTCVQGSMGCRFCIVTMDVTYLEPRTSRWREAKPVSRLS